MKMLQFLFLLFRILYMDIVTYTRKGILYKEMNIEYLQQKYIQRNILKLRKSIPIIKAIKCYWHLIALDLWNH